MKKPIKVLHLSTHYEDCGVGKYQEQFLEHMEHAKIDSIENKFFGYSPNKTRLMSKDGLSIVLKELQQELDSFDILHIQHEFSFYAQDEFVKFCQVAVESKKQLIVTYHTSPAFVIKTPHLGGLGPRSILHFLRAIRYKRRMVARHIKPAFQADLVIAHNQTTIDALVAFGISPQRIKKLQLPVPKIKEYEDTSQEIQGALRTSPSDVIFCTVGFMHRFKGLFDAVKALRYLPPNYKLAIVGGISPTSDDHQIYNKITDLVADCGLQDRVYITGFVKDDVRLDKLIQECDVCIYPYDKTYYAGVSSASMNIAFSNKMPVIAYPVQTFVEIEQSSGAIELTNGFSYYELARTLKTADLTTLKEKSQDYAKAESYSVITHDLVKIYEEVVSN
ncbi:MAG: group 1 glycosyl transferase [Candidatus Saccharibacteria bacterium]|nr:group 1 glycosyl transferase [Candidatus Saccharibacteria bacterium]